MRKAFNMKRTTLTLAACSAAASFVHSAETPLTRTPPVVVTATRFGDSPRLSPLPVQVIDADEIRRSPASTLPELLSQYAGIRARDLTGSPDMQIDLRGFGIFGDQNTLVLVDGRRVSENEQTAVSWSAIPLSAIERVEILRGGGSVLYGAGATGGTINIITKAPRAGERSGSLEAGAGSYRTFEQSGGVNLGAERLSLRMNASHLDGRGYRDNNARQQGNAQADLRLYADRGYASIKAGVDEQRLELPGSLSEAQIAANRRQAATPGDFSNRRSGYVDLGGEHALGAAKAAANLTYREKDTDASFFVATPFRNTVGSHVSMWSFNPRLQTPHRLGGWDNTLIAGVDLDDWTFEATAGPSIVGRPTAGQRNAALYVQHTSAFSTGTSVSLGGRVQRVKYDVSDPTSPAAAFERNPTLHAYEVAVRQRVVEPLSVYAKIGSSFRVPNVNDLYSLFTASVTPLEPQTARDREAGVEGAWRGARYRLTWYHIDVANEIFFDPITFTNRNLQPTRRSGAEADVSWTAGRLSAFANYTYAASVFRSGTFGGVSIAGNDVPLVPRQSAGAGITWKLMPTTQASLVARYVGKRRFDNDETNTFARRMPSYTILDAKLVHERRNWLFQAVVRNLTNERYFSYGVFTGFPTFAALPAPERSFFASAQYTFR
jgi:iron complex outermembrane receptor protein